MPDMNVNNIGMVSGINHQNVYVNQNLPWMNPNNNLNSTAESQDVWNWLLSDATTAQEKAEVLQSEAYDKANPGNLSALGNGTNENTLFGWGMMGVNPFNPYGPPGQSPNDNALKAAVSNAFTSDMSGQNGYEKDPHARKANEILRQTLVMVQATYGTHLKTHPQYFPEVKTDSFSDLSA